MALDMNLKKIYRCDIFLSCELILWSSSIGINRELKNMAWFVYFDKNECVVAEDEDGPVRVEGGWKDCVVFIS